jgi:radical SAM protein with 4Fe4S-binding SPASM domain
MTRFHDMGGRLALPEMIEIEPTESCNLRCRMCHVSYMPVERRAFFDVTHLQRLGALRGRFVSVASGFEPMIHPDFEAFMGGLTELEARIQIITNGTRCSAEAIATLVASSLEIVSFSFDGIRAATYEHIRRGANFERTLAAIVATREAFRRRETRFCVNTTVMRCNLEESEEAVGFWDERGFDVLRFLLMVVRYPVPELVRESLYPVREQAREVFERVARRVIDERLRILVARPYHQGSLSALEHPGLCTGKWVRSGNPDARVTPSFREVFQLGDHEAMPHWRCRAPFNSATILANGDVQLCFKYSVGNLRDGDFEDIWYGEAADRARQIVMRDVGDCRACDCWRFGMASDELDEVRVESYFAHELASAAHSIDWETGEFAEPPAKRPPRLVAAEGRYNVVFWDERYLAIPQAVGALELDKVDLSRVPGLIASDSFARVMHLLARAEPDP